MIHISCKEVFFTCAAAQKSHVYMIPKMIHDLHSFKQLHFAI